MDRGGISRVTADDGGETELNKLVLLCPYHHRLHHRGLITITGPAGKSVSADLAANDVSHPVSRRCSG